MDRRRHHPSRIATDHDHRQDMDGSHPFPTDSNHKKYDRRHQRYPSDLNNEEWQVLEPMRPVAKGVGRPRVHSLREIVNGIRYMQRYGIPWDAMPKDLPPSSICYDFWRLLTDQRHIAQINHLLVMADREKSGREASPTLAIIDAQSIECHAPDGDRGYDAAKRCRAASDILQSTPMDVF